MRVLHVASEVAPFAQSGGLADVLGGLPPALAQRAASTSRVLLPLYRGVEAKLARCGRHARRGHADRDPRRPAHVPGVAAHAHASAASRYGFVDCAAALRSRRRALRPDAARATSATTTCGSACSARSRVEHGAELVGGAARRPPRPRLAGRARRDLRAHRATRRAAIVTTIHNLAYRGIFPKHVMTDLGFPWSLFTIQRPRVLRPGLVPQGRHGASPTSSRRSARRYAQEILTPQFGEALDGFLQLRRQAPRRHRQRHRRRRRGIPRPIAALPARFSATDARRQGAVPARARERARPHARRRSAADRA